MTIERLEELKNTLYEALHYQENCRDWDAEEQMEKDINKLIDAEIERQSKVTPTTKLLDSAKRYVLTHMVWYEDTTFREPKLSDLGELIVNLIDDEINRLREASIAKHSR